MNISGDVSIFSAKRLVFIVMALLITFSMTGCVKTVGVGSFQHDEDNHFKILNETGKQRIDVLLEYSKPVNEIAVKDVIVNGSGSFDMNDVYRKNTDLYEKHNKVIDCVSIFPDRFETCSTAGKNDYTLFRKTNFDAFAFVFDTAFLLPVDVVATVFFQPFNPYANAITGVFDIEALYAVGAEANGKLLKHLQEKCTVDDPKLSVWYQGTCSGGYADGEGIAKGDDTYSGSFSHGKLNGKGEYLWKNGDRYVGEFVDGYITGDGAISWSNGDEYIGEFFKGGRLGHGKYVHKSGTVEEGIFLDSKLVPSEIACDKAAVDFLIKYYRGEAGDFMGSVKLLPIDSAVTVYKYTNDPKILSYILDEYRSFKTANGYFSAFKLSKHRSDIGKAFEYAITKEQRLGLEQDALKVVNLEKDVFDIKIKCDSMNSASDDKSSSDNFLLFNMENKSSTADFVCSTSVAVKPDSLVPLSRKYRLKVDYSLKVTTETYTGISRESTGSALGDVFWGVVRAATSNTKETTVKMDKSLYFVVQPPKNKLDAHELKFDSVAVSAKTQALGGFMEREMKLKGRAKVNFNITEVSAM
ncbi:hypothetical protein LPW11_04030 [Geomonas sp. RF6]|uniref:MORN repeat-containing protein n=1 Tax=Geomonas sp. RF6 TaxID=2897342 RepID=UPI001E547793|nr:hypothetical protein [Geomonas sp. RF6]UFS71367.1 hypothetical protein LPW11_04030 [Geomonas sp. RF6]